MELGAGWGATVRAALVASTETLPAGVILQELEVFGEYLHSLVRTKGAEGSVGVAIGPAQATASVRRDRTEESRANLTLRARFVSRESLSLSSGVPALPEPAAGEGA